MTTRFSSTLYLTWSTKEGDGYTSSCITKLTSTHLSQHSRNCQISSLSAAGSVRQELLTALWDASAHRAVWWDRSPPATQNRLPFYPENQPAGPNNHALEMGLTYWADCIMSRGGH